MTPKKPKGEERRRSPRIEAEHPLVLRAHGGDGVEFTATSVNMALNGIYCHVDRHVPLFAKIDIAVTLPLRDDDLKVHDFGVHLTGAVVRMEPEEPEEGRTDYYCALAFVDTTPESELIVARYLLQKMVAVPSAT